ncbi:MAG: metal-dependent transcriptional regulator [Collinsella sp.]|nr:metal-dependent transcriptional regulator [Collinsella sp.]
MDAVRSTSELHLTVANEDYLECMVRIESEDSEGAGVRSVDIAQQLGVSKASVSKAVAALKSQGLVEQSHYGRVVLTEEGRKIGRAVWYRHRLIRTFLVSELGVDFERADSEACMMEHALSEDTMTRWLSYLEDQGIVVGKE